MAHKENGKGLAEALMEAAGEANVLQKEPMASHTTFRIGGPADYFVRPASAAQAAAVRAAAARFGAPCLVIGNGSNLLVGDLGVPGVVLQLHQNFGEIQVGEATLTAQAGATNARVAKEAQKAGLGGFAFAAGIPGTVGGAVVMNAGAYGGEMKDILQEVTVLTEDGEIRTVPADGLELSYRASNIRKNGWVILTATFRLFSQDPAKIQAQMDDLRARRQEKQPLEFPSAGSTFKRPEGHFAGKLIMDAGLAGMRVGGAQVSPKHCGFVVNTGDATASDVRCLIEEVRQKVLDAFGVELEPEVQYVGRFA